MRSTWLRWAGLSLCYLAFAGSLSKAEGVAAVLTGAFAAILSLGLRTEGERRLPLHGRWAPVLAQAMLQLARDIAKVGLTLLRALFRGRGHRGQVVHDRQSAERPIGARAGHRAATALLASLTPDGVAVETGEDTIPVHRLSRRSRSARERSGAR